MFPEGVKRHFNKTGGYGINLKYRHELENTLKAHSEKWSVIDKIYL